MTATVDSDADAPGHAWQSDDAPMPTPYGPYGPRGSRGGRGSVSRDERRRRTLVIAMAAVLGAATVGAIVTASDSRSSDALDASAGEQSADGSGDAAGTPADGAASGVDAASAVPVADVTAGQDASNGVADGGAAGALPDLEGELGQNEASPEGTIESDEAERADGGCTIGALSIRAGTSGDGVTCLQNALIDAGYYSGPANGSFDTATDTAVRRFQEAEDLFVDGVVGRESAIELDIWPDEASLVVHTPPPALGAMDSMGYRLSPVASTGADAPPLPDNSGSGRRVVYDRAGQRVWAVGEDGQIIRSWLVTGSKYMNEMPGTHTVYSRSDMSTAWNGKAWLPQMIRYQRTEIGHIGFHAIPLHVSDNSPYQTTAELGTRLSGGCQRQHNDDSAFMWEFAQVGTTVVVT